MAIHHTRRKKAASLVGEEKDQGKIISLLKTNEFTDDEIMELLQETVMAPVADNSKFTITLADPKVLESESIKGYDTETTDLPKGIQMPGSNVPPVKQSKYADFDVFMAQAIVKDYRHISNETRTYISHFQINEKVQTVRIEPALAKEFNRFALGFVETPGRMYFPKGEKKNGDIQTYKDPTYKPLQEETVTNEFMD